MGAARAGFEVCGAVDIYPEAINAHKSNFPHSIHLSTSVADITGETLKRSLDLTNGDLDGIIGGPPCQGFSYMGNRDENDARNELFAHFFRLVGETLPRFYLAENVPGIMREKYSRTRDKAFSYVENKYVVLPPIVISANDYGVPTLRKRVFFCGYRSDEMEPLTAASLNPPSSVEIVHVKDALRGLPKKINPAWRTEEQSWRVVHVHGNGYYASRLHGHVPRGIGNSIALERLRKESRASGFLGTVHSPAVAERYAKIESGKCDSITKSCRLKPDGFCPTLRAGTGPEQGSYQAVRPLHPTENRVITPREAARLQGFPDWFQFSPTKWHSFRLIGSSVSPIVAEHILAVIRSAL